MEQDSGSVQMYQTQYNFSSSASQQDSESALAEIYSNLKNDFMPNTTKQKYELMTQSCQK